ncbi:MAG TPA: ABC transporter ATP-binding protein [Gemmatales bacterium]|nr:ABC transporter ATP-binding protein [Gemmatales bacterium]HMP17673.1 ABC transporter ATP-binding protein [Gemmatales bacterium]
MNAILQLKNVSKWYGPVLGLSDVSLQVGSGITGLVGPNGAGKSTLMKLATGQLRPELGDVLVCAKPAWSASAKHHLGFCPENDVFYEEMTGRQFVRSMSRLCGYGKREAFQRADAAIELVGMKDRADKKVRGFSKGMRQRVKLAQALVHDPQLLILDEPMNGVDPVGRLELYALFEKLSHQGKALLISSHQLEELEKLTNRYVIIARGILIATGTLSEIRDQLADIPLSIRLDCDHPRKLAADLLPMQDVLGVELADVHSVIVRVQHSRRFFANLGEYLAREQLALRRMESLDMSTAAVLEYVLQGR